MSRSAETYEARLKAWSEVAANFGLQLEVFAEPPAKGRLGRIAQRLGGGSAGVLIAGNRVGYVLSGRVQDVDVTVVAGTSVGDMGDNNAVVSEITHYRAAAPWIPDDVRVGARQFGVKDRLKFANGGSKGWEWLDLGDLSLHVRSRDETATRAWLAATSDVLVSSFAANGQLRVIDGGVETDTSNVESDQQVLESRIREVHHLALQLRPTDRRKEGSTTTPKD